MSGRVLIATRSAGKLRELIPMFARAGISATDLASEGVVESPEEDDLEVHDTFEENALAKARYFARLTGMSVVADDSGLAVDALGGAPGVRSKRWSGRADLSGQALDDSNNELLLTSIAGTADRRARYICVAVFVGEGREIVRRGESTGVIVSSPRGGSGFGYDPYFLSDDLGRTFAECDEREKASVSHRGRAFAALVAQLRAGVDRREISD